jgi:lipopolysaccharide/colanic/teichoic acid biosynthesis glycosyltransferase
MSMLSFPIDDTTYPTLESAIEYVPRSIPYSVRIAKRCVDVIIAIFGLLVTAVLFPFIALAIYIDSPGPIFYRQIRAAAIGKRNARGHCKFESFGMMKFRSMRVDAEKHTGIVLAGENDPRVTRVGRFMRKTRLDELPQFYNVLIGEMSVVGPRPERPELFENLSLAIPFFEERMRDCKPGITGLAQVSLGYTGRAPMDSEVSRMEDVLVNPFKLDGTEGSEADDMRTKLLFDLAYVASLERFSTFIGTELLILVKTPFVMARGIGR